MERDKTMQNAILLIGSFLLTLSMSSCASPRSHVYLTRDISKYDNPVLFVSSDELSVKYETEKAIPQWALLFGPLVWAGEYASRAGSDDKLTEAVTKSGVASYCETQLGEVFLEMVQNQKVFRKISVCSTTDRLAESGYDLSVVLRIDELNLKKNVGTGFNIYASVSGEMIDLKEGTTIWQRQETPISDEAYSIEAYSANENAKLKDVLNKVLKKVAFRFAVDMMK